jgi:hypothetical protein
MAANQKPTDAEIVKFASDVSYNMGCAAAVLKFANALRANHPKEAQELVSRIAPDQIEMLQDLAAAGMSLTS